MVPAWSAARRPPLSRAAHRIRETSLPPLLSLRPSSRRHARRSYTLDARDAEAEYFPSEENQWTCVFTGSADGDVDHASPAAQRELAALARATRALADENAARGGDVVFSGWWDTFEASRADADGAAGADAFRDDLLAFTAQHRGHLRWVWREPTRGAVDAAPTLAATQACFAWRRTWDVREEIRWMRGARARVKAAAPSLRARVYTKYFYSLEILAVVVPETARSLALVCVVVVACVAPALRSLRLGALVLLTMGLILSLIHI